MLFKILTVGLCYLAAFGSFAAGIGLAVNGRTWRERVGGAGFLVMAALFAALSFLALASDARASTQRPQPCNVYLPVEDVRGPDRPDLTVTLRWVWNENLSSFTGERAGLIPGHCYHLPHFDGLGITTVRSTLRSLDVVYFPDEPSGLAYTAPSPCPPGALDGTRCAP